MRNPFKRRRRELPQAEAIDRLRSQMRAFGWPVDRLSDEELVDGVVQLSRAVRRAGVPARVASVRMSDAMREMNASLPASAGARKANMQRLARAAGATAPLAARLREAR